MQWREVPGEEKSGAFMGKTETSECGVGVAASGPVISLGEDLMRFGNEHRNILKISKCDRRG